LRSAMVVGRLGSSSVGAHDQRRRADGTGVLRSGPFIAVHRHTPLGLALASGKC
jgi:hypothetical protein